jgi:hypothetical protein
MDVHSSPFSVRREIQFRVWGSEFCVRWALPSEDEHEDDASAEALAKEDLGADFGAPCSQRLRGQIPSSLPFAFSLPVW